MMNSVDFLKINEKCIAAEFIINFSSTICFSGKSLISIFDCIELN